VARLFERALRKLQLPVAYTEGFSPRPKLSFGLALTVAHESEAEYLDVELKEAIDLAALPAELTAALPDGMAVDAVVVNEPGTPSLQQAIVSCDWQIEVLGATEDHLRTAVADVLAAEELPLERVRKGKTTVADVRPAILLLEVAGPTNDGVMLTVTLATESVSLRPAELVRVLGDQIPPEGAEDGLVEDHLVEHDLVEGRVRRTHQWIIVDGARREPVRPPGQSTRHDMKRAS
jgi:radical SAM-linked protein